ncbi:MAG: hypothetical protein IKR73_00490 [Oscillospiraceae bacterium]|nr:hypothetical protein [Oscillospiraceae bacterium]
MERIVETIQADMAHLTDTLLEEHSVRLYSRGGHFSKSEMIPVYFLMITGCGDPDAYNNFLFDLKGSYLKSGKPFALIDEPISLPRETLMLLSSVDTSSPASVISGLCGLVSVNGDTERTVIAQKALGEMLSKADRDMFTIGGMLALKMTFISRAIGVGGDRIPVILYYGVPSAEDVLFLCFAQRSGFDVLCISPDDAAKDIFDKCPFAAKIQHESLGASHAVMPFPTAPVKAKVSTVAYNAERELDSMLYSGDTMFRAMQFTKISSVVLQTTYDEIDLLWDQEAKYRPGFAVNGDIVTIPVVFAKINGVPGGMAKIGAYWEMIEDLITYKSIYIIKAPAYRTPGLSASRQYAPFHRGKQIDIDGLLRSRLNRYGFLQDHLQRMIFEKAQAIIDDGLLIMDSEQETVDYVMHVALNLNERILRLLQQYDFTKEIPKAIVVDTIEDPFSKLECTQLLMLSYLGFDVLIFAPSGYRDIETYVSERAFETHNAGEYTYGLKAPKFKIPTVPRQRRKQQKGLFGGLFKKGR